MVSGAKSGENLILKLTVIYGKGRGCNYSKYQVILSFLKVKTNVGYYL